MVLAHVMSDEENKSIMQTTIQELFPVKNIATPYMYHHIVEALFEAGLDEEAIHLMKSYWGKMISLGRIPTGKHSIRISRSILRMVHRS